MSAQSRSTAPRGAAAIAIGFLMLVALAFVFPPPANAQQGNPHLVLTLPEGEVDIALLPELAPAHVERIITLTEQGFYDGIVFHRVIDGFMAQTGDPTGTGAGGSDLPDLVAEISPEPFVRGVVGFAHAGGPPGELPNTANSQFFITYADAPWLNNGYTVFGRVVSGMEAVDALEKGEGQGGTVRNPDAITSAVIEYR
jgi:peptidylprolyl isomerase